MRRLESLSIGGISVLPGLLLAPVAGYTDSPYRRIVKSFCAGAVFTEMVSIEGITRNNRETINLMYYKEDEHPIFLQLFGADPDHFAFAAKVAEEKGFDGIDINAGCPVSKVVKEGSGASLLRDRSRLAAIIRSIKKVCSLPLTLKVRKGFVSGDNVLKEILRIAETEGVDALIIHGITAEEGFRLDAEDWNSIAEIASVAKIPIVGNGGIRTEQDVTKMLTETGVDGVMVGRAALGKPWFLKSSQDYFERKSVLNVTNEEKMNIIIRHAEEEVDLRGEEKAIVEMRKFLMHYVSGMENSSYVRLKINRLRKLDELRSLVRAFFVSKEEGYERKN